MVTGGLRSFIVCVIVCIFLILYSTTVHVWHLHTYRCGVVLPFVVLYSFQITCFGTRVCLPLEVSSFKLLSEIRQAVSWERTKWKLTKLVNSPWSHLPKFSHLRQRVSLIKRARSLGGDNRIDIGLI